MPRISVIIPTYNRENFISYAIDSVLKQDYNDYEIIVIDDGSTDNTEEVLKQYKKVIIYIYQENSGVSSARNTGIMVAKGEWIAFLDSDDEWDEDYLSTQFEHIKKYPDSIAYITNSNTIYFDGSIENHFTGIKLLKQFGNNSCLTVERPLRMIVEHGYWFLQSIIMRKSILFETGLFDPDLSIAEDLDLISRVALKGKYTVCRKEKVKIIRREETLENLTARSRRKMRNRCESYIKVYSRLLDDSNTNQKEIIIIKKILSLHLRLFGNVLLLDGNKKEAMEQYKKAYSQCASVRSYLKILLCTMPLAISKALTRKIGY